MKKTGWYEGWQKPVRVGAYERKYQTGICAARWNGEKWVGFAYSITEKDMLANEIPCFYQTQVKWRGLAEPA